MSGITLASFKKSAVVTAGQRGRKSKINLLDILATLESGKLYTIPYHLNKEDRTENSVAGATIYNFLRNNPSIYFVQVELEGIPSFVLSKDLIEGYPFRRYQDKQTKE